MNANANIAGSHSVAPAPVPGPAPLNPLVGGTPPGGPALSPLSVPASPRKVVSMTPVQQAGRRVAVGKWWKDPDSEVWAEAEKLRQLLPRSDVVSELAARLEGLVEPFVVVRARRLGLTSAEERAVREAAHAAIPESLNLYVPANVGKSRRRRTAGKRAAGAQVKHLLTWVRKAIRRSEASALGEPKNRTRVSHWLLIKPIVEEFESAGDLGADGSARVAEELRSRQRGRLKEDLLGRAPSDAEMAKLDGSPKPLAKLLRKAGRSPGHGFKFARLAKELKYLSEKQVENALEFGCRVRTVSLDAPAGAEPNAPPLAALLADPSIPNPSEELVMKDPTAIKKALLDLSPTEREVVLLHAVDGWEHSEIAKELGILEANSRQIYRRAMAKLKKRLGGHEGNGDEGDLCTH